MQLCLANGIHLTVTKGLYKKVPKASSLKVIKLRDDPESEDETDDFDDSDKVSEDNEGFLFGDRR